jgi:2-methylcitrate synthase
MAEEQKIVAGLAGIAVGESSICTVGQGLGLNYRGYDIQDLAEKCECFEEVAYLLLHGELPTRAELDNYIRYMASLRDLPASLKVVLENTPPTAHPMDVLRSTVSVLGTLEPESTMDAATGVKIGERLIAVQGPALLYWHHFHHSKQRINPNTKPTDTIARNFLKLLYNDNKEPDELRVRTFEVSLILYAEHEFTASTFTARVVASTLSDMHSCITAAIGALRGPLHGGANEAAMNLIAKFSSPDEAEKGLLDMLHRKELIFGFGHRVYKRGDPRSPIIKSWSKKLSEQPYGSPKLFAVSERIDKVMEREKKMFTNLDFYSASAYNQCGVPTSFFTPIFVVSRTSGWVAHVIEQRQNNKLIRPSSVYNGPQPKTYVEIHNRRNSRL